jgi:hypothetical protein
VTGNRSVIACLFGKTATGINIHSGQASGRASQGCMNIDPKSNWFSCAIVLSPTINVVTPKDGNPGKGNVSHSDIVNSHFGNSPIVPNGGYLGDFYLNRL